MIKLKLSILCLLLHGVALSQCDVDLNMFKHYSIYEQEDTINFHIYSKGNLDTTSNILFFAHGSGAFPLYQIKRVEGSFWMNSRVPIQVNNIPSDFAFVLISKPGMPFCAKLGEPYDIPPVFYEKETLEKRTYYADRTIEYILDSLIPNPIKVIALGHSEGSDVVAKLGTRNSSITHIGYLSGGGNSQFYDFSIMIRKEVLKGEISDEDGIFKIDSLMLQYKDIVAKKDSLNKVWQGNSYKRWYYFSEPPIDNLLQFDKPLFVAIGSDDKAVPIESTYLIPIEFIRRGKNNLTFKVYPGLSHNFASKLENEETESHWAEIFNDFIKWVEKN